MIESNSKVLGELDDAGARGSPTGSGFNLLFSPQPKKIEDISEIGLVVECGRCSVVSIGCASEFFRRSLETSEPGVSGAGTAGASALGGLIQTALGSCGSAGCCTK